MTVNKNVFAISLRTRNRVTYLSIDDFEMVIKTLGCFLKITVVWFCCQIWQVLTEAFPVYTFENFKHLLFIVPCAVLEKYLRFDISGFQLMWRCVRLFKAIASREHLKILSKTGTDQFSPSCIAQYTLTKELFTNWKTSVFSRTLNIKKGDVYNFFSKKVVSCSQKINRGMFWIFYLFFGTDWCWFIVFCPEPSSSFDLIGERQFLIPSKRQWKNVGTVTLVFLMCKSFQM